MFVVDKDSRTLRLSIMMNVNVTNKGKKMQPTNVQASTMNTLAAREFLRSFLGVCGGEVRLVVVRGGEDILFVCVCVVFFRSRQRRVQVPS